MPVALESSGRRWRSGCRLQARSGMRSWPRSWSMWRACTGTRCRRGWMSRNGFSNRTWILSPIRPIRMNALVFAPGAFLRHGAIPDPRDLDRRGGERHEWVP